MKKLGFALIAATLIGAQAQAGGMEEPMMEPVVIVEEAANDSAQGPIVMALAILAVFGAALSH